MTGIEVPLELAAVLCAASLAAGVWGGQVRANRRLDPRRARADDPVRELLKPENLSRAIDLAARRNAAREGAQAMLHGRIDQLAQVSELWNRATRSEVREHVAAVMRAGLRRDDRITLSPDGRGGDGFTIIIPGADERTAVRIADRLRRALAQLRLPQLGSEARLTASFGIAAERFGDGAEGLDDRARRALDAALAKGADHVVPASEIEEVMLLPAPAATALPAASAA
jgi:diguanylate cyclase (GGDEF)-like protein